MKNRSNKSAETDSSVPYCVALPAGDEWLHTPEIKKLYDENQIDDSTYVWAEGWPDWVVLSSVAEIARAIAPARAGGESMKSLQLPISVQTAVSSEKDEKRKSKKEKRAAIVKRGGAREKRDMFAEPPSDHLMVDAHPEKAPDLHSHRTGERNENSVLFSLATMQTKEEAAAAKRTKEHSGIIDLKALLNAKTEPAPIAPLFTPPPAEAWQLPTDRPPPPRDHKRTILLSAIAAIGVIVFGGGALALSSGDDVAHLARSTALPSPALGHVEMAIRANSNSQLALGTPGPSAYASHGHGHGHKGRYTVYGAHESGGGVSAPSAPARSASDPCGCNNDLMCLMKCSAKH